VDSDGKARARALLLKVLGQEEVDIYDRTGGIRFRSADDKCTFHVHKFWIGFYQLGPGERSISHKVFSYPIVDAVAEVGLWCFEDRVLSFMLYDAMNGSDQLQQTGCAQPYIELEGQEVLGRLVHTVKSPCPYGQHCDDECDGGE